MKKLVFLLIVMLFSILACAQEEEKTANPHNNVANQNPGVRAGKVLDILDTEGYVYLQLEEKERTYWIAVPTMSIEKGEIVYFSKYMEMRDYHSKTLNRKFESVLFVEDANKMGGNDELKTAHSNVNSNNKEEINIDKVDGGNTIAEIFSQKKELNGKTIKVKGKVVKFSSSIMNRNWIHIQDGTADNGNYDLLITSDETVKVGDIIIAEGKLATDKDFGAGYFYPVLVEEAKIINE